jgi:hypothetical protein
MKSILKNLAFFALCVMLAAGLAACGDDDNSGGSDPTLLIGTWDMTEENGSSVPSGTVALVINDDTTYGVVSTDCAEGGTYTANSTTITITVLQAFGLSCSYTAGDVIEMQYTVNSTTLTITEGGDTMVFNKL